MAWQAYYEEGGKKWTTEIPFFLNHSNFGGLPNSSTGKLIVH